MPFSWFQLNKFGGEIELADAHEEYIPATLNGFPAIASAAHIDAAADINDGLLNNTL
jgi:hypothetical protein